MTEIRVENVYSNIDPVTGGVAISERVMQQSRNEYFQMTSSSHLPYGHSYASGGEWVHRGGFKKKVQHLLTWNFLLKIVEIVLLIACASLYTNRLHQVLNTTGTMIMPCATYLSLFLITTCIAVCVAVKGKVSNLFTVSFHTMAVLLLFVSGGVIFGMWYSMPRKVKSTFFWEAVMMLSQISLSFLVGVVYLADLALSLDAVNKRR